MSQAQQSGELHGSPAAPSLEPWFIVCLLALVPGMLIVFLPRAAMSAALVPIIGSMVLLTVVGLAMLWRAERGGRKEEVHQRDEPDPGGARDS